MSGGTLSPARPRLLRHCKVPLRNEMYMRYAQKNNQFI